MHYNTGVQHAKRIAMVRVEVRCSCSSGLSEVGQPEPKVWSSRGKFFIFRLGNHSRLSSRSEDPTIKGGEGGFFFCVLRGRALLEDQALMGSFGSQFVTCAHGHLFGGQSWPGWSGSLRPMIWSWKMAPYYGGLLHLRPKDDYGLDHDLRIFRSSDHPARTDPL